MGTEFQFQKMKKFSRWILVIVDNNVNALSATIHLEMVKNGKFCYIYFITSLKKGW